MYSLIIYYTTHYYESRNFFLFCSNYAIFYVATGYLTSGLVAVVFSTVVFWNIFFARILSGTPVSARVVFSTLIGVAGLALVFWPEIADMQTDGSVMHGLILCVIATVLASLGNITSGRNQKQGLPVLQSNAYGMAYGAFFTALYGFCIWLYLGQSWPLALISRC